VSGGPVDEGAVAHGADGGADDGAVETILGVASFVDLPARCPSCGAAVERGEWPALAELGEDGACHCGPMVLRPCGHELAGG
jgi:hypothetical protein